MVEEQVEVEVLSADLERILAADKGESLAQLENESPNLLGQALFDRALFGFGCERQEVEGVGILDELLGELGLLGGQGAMEVGESSALPCEQTTLDLMSEDVTAPAVLDGLACVPFALDGALHERRADA